MDENSPENAPEPAQLKFLRRLVTTLTAVMIFGLITIIALIVIRMMTPAGPPLPDVVTMPDGARATAFTRGPDWYAVVTDDDRIVIFDAESGAVRQVVQIEAP